MSKAGGRDLIDRYLRDNGLGFPGSGRKGREIRNGLPDTQNESTRIRSDKE